MKRFLLLQLRPEDETSDEEYELFMKFGGLKPEQVHRMRIERTGITEEINLDNYRGVIVGGTPFNVSDPDYKKTDEQKKAERDLHNLLDEVIARDFPFLGACYGVGLLADYLEPGSVAQGRYKEDVGATTVKLVKPEADNDPLTRGLPEEFRAFVGHKESAQKVPKGAVHLARADGCPVEMFRYKQNIYATQFHPELDSKGLETRINIYKHAGYFPPEAAEELIEAAHKETITVPEQILRRFVERYQQ